MVMITMMATRVLTDDEYWYDKGDGDTTGVEVDLDDDGSDEYINNTPPLNA